MPRARSHQDAPFCGVTDRPSTSPALSLRAVVQLTGLSKAYIYNLIAQGNFPRPAKVGRRSIWNSQEIFAWLEARFAERPARQGALSDVENSRRRRR